MYFGRWICDTGGCGKCDGCQAETERDSALEQVRVLREACNKARSAIEVASTPLPEDRAAINEAMAQLYDALDATEPKP